MMVNCLKIRKKYSNRIKSKRKWKRIAHCLFSLMFLKVLEIMRLLLRVYQHRVFNIFFSISFSTPCKHKWCSNVLIAERIKYQILHMLQNAERFKNKSLSFISNLYTQLNFDKIPHYGDERWNLRRSLNICS